jgi:hypothetical protein
MNGEYSVRKLQCKGRCTLIGRRGHPGEFGEGMWRKGSVLELQTRVPLTFSGPVGSPLLCPIVLQTAI